MKSLAQNKRDRAGVSILIGFLYFYIITKQTTKSGVCIFKILDHLPTFCIVENARCLSDAKTKFIRNMRHFSLEIFLIDLDNEFSSPSQDSSGETNTASANQDATKLVNMFNSIIDRHAALRPMSRQENRLSDKPWITRGILTSIKTKNKLFKKYLKNKNIDTDKSKKEHYKKYLSKLTRVKNLAKRIY